MFWRTLGCVLALGVMHMAYAGMGEKGTQPDVLRANQLIGLSVQTPGGENLGSLTQIIFGNGHVAFWMLTSDIAQLKDRYLLIPREKLSLVPGERMHFTFDITRERLAGAPSFAWGNCPELSKPEVSKPIFDYYGVAYQGLPATATGKTMCYCPAAYIIGTRVEARRHEEVGTIEDVAIDLREGRLAYGVVSLGAMKDLASKICVVPWSALRMLPGRGLARVHLDRATLGSYAVTWSDFPNLDDLTVASAIFQRFHREPYWEVYGSTAHRFAAWQPGSAYNRLFTSGNVATYEGKIISIGTFFPGRGAAPGVRVVLKTDDNKWIVAHLGPFSYVFGGGFRFGYGDRVKLSGSLVTWDGYSIVMGSEVSLGDRVLKLRDVQGVPLWHLGEAGRAA